MAPTASLVLITRNRAGFLARTLASLVHQSTADFEVVLVDDGSEDDTREVVRGFANRLDLRYERRAARGIAAARNAGIRAARGEVLVFVDDDRVAARDFVADHLAAHADGVPRLAGGCNRGLFAVWSREAAYRAADVAALLARRPELAPHLAGPQAELVTVADIEADLDAVLADFALDEPWWQGWVQLALDAHGPSLAGFPFPWTLTVTGNMSVRRALVEQVGLMDETFVGWGLEDTELCYRMVRAGAAVRVLEGGTSYHQVHRRGAERSAEWGQNALRFLAKHGALDVCLYIAVMSQRLSMPAATAILREHAALGGAAPALTAELIRVHRDHLRLLAASARA